MNASLTKARTRVLSRQRGKKIFSRAEKNFPQVDAIARHSAEMVYLRGHFDRKRHHAGDKFRLSRAGERASVTVGIGPRARQAKGKNGVEKMKSL
jgi:hypothetical protein